MEIDKFVNKIICGDVIDVLKDIPDNSVNCVVTSPPYWGLRDYGVEGQIGLEEHPQEYINKIVKVFHEVKRVLREDGTLFLNIGDTYYTKSGSNFEGSSENFTKRADKVGLTKINYLRELYKSNWLQPKQKLMIPERVAIAMQEDGWILRNDIIWYKPNHMPSSVRDRLTNAYEHVYLFVKNRKYYFDLDAIREPFKVPTERANKLLVKLRKIYELLRTNNLNRYAGKDVPKNYMAHSLKINLKSLRDAFKLLKNEVTMTKEEELFLMDYVQSRGTNLLGKNPSDMWIINTQPFKESHFAVFPTKLVEKCLKAGCPRWICRRCGKPRIRIVVYPSNPSKPYENNMREEAEEKGYTTHSASRLITGLNYKTAEEKIYKGKTIGWTDCGCNAGFVGGIVLDPFVGSGTTCVVAKQLGLRYIGIDINPEYCEMAKRRLSSIPTPIEMFLEQEIILEFIDESEEEIELEFEDEDIKLEFIE